MKKQKIQMIVLVCLLLIVAVFFIVMKKTDLFKEEDTAEETYSVLDIDSDKVTQISYNINSEEIDLRKSDDSWTLTGNEGAGLDNGVINTLIDTASSVTSTVKLDNVDDLSEYGLDNPDNTITLTLDDGTKIRLLIGAKENMSSGYYAAIDGEKTVYVISNAYHSGVLKSADSLMKNN